MRAREDVAPCDALSGVRVAAPLHRETHYFGSSVFLSAGSVTGLVAFLLAGKTSFCGRSNMRRVSRSMFRRAIVALQAQPPVPSQRPLDATVVTLAPGDVLPDALLEDRLPRKRKSRSSDSQRTRRAHKAARAHASLIACMYSVIHVHEPQRVPGCLALDIDKVPPRRSVQYRRPGTRHSGRGRRCRVGVQTRTFAISHATCAARTKRERTQTGIIPPE
jgi:hypothetical protein